MPNNRFSIKKTFLKWIRLKNPKQFMHLSSLLLLFILFAATPIVLALMPKISVEDLTKEADVIVIGDIKEVNSSWNLWRTMVYTYSSVSVEKYIKGTGSETLTIITEGGTVEDSGMWVEDTPGFTKNEKVLVFLKKAGREFRVAGLVQGKYIVENEELRDRSGEKVSLNDFLRRVEDAIPPQDAVTPIRTQAAQASLEAPGFGVILAVTSLLVVTIRRRKKMKMKIKFFDFRIGNLTQLSLNQQIYSSKIKTSSILDFNTLATSYASFNEGLYFPFSRKTIVSLLTPTLLASSSWVKSYLARSSLILVFIIFRLLRQDNTR
jgi:hypothetical protein